MVTLARKSTVISYLPARFVGVKVKLIFHPPCCTLNHKLASYVLKCEYNKSSRCRSAHKTQPSLWCRQKVNWEKVHCQNYFLFVEGGLSYHLVLWLYSCQTKTNISLYWSSPYFLVFILGGLAICMHCRLTTRRYTECKSGVHKFCTNSMQSWFFKRLTKFECTGSKDSTASL